MKAVLFSALLILTGALAAPAGADDRPCASASPTAAR
ncbi:hypothetical protein ASALC70_04143 [Alcanivorax sp. ALC70]|nr:hypothetical protein ASALC70_04143 [Alcanivorax sp. ALC70]